ncbi:MAG: phosphatase [Planctomycetes bacterium]|nr:phosphatase [Planctomycetota bacterium]
MHLRNSIAFSAALATAAAALSQPAHATLASGYTGVPSANPKTSGIAVPNVLTPELVQTALVQGSAKLENGTSAIPYYGYCGDGTMLPAPGAVQLPGSNIEATKSEPDKNVYLVLPGQTGADAAYDYGTHFVYQGHENAAVDAASGLKTGYITRVNLDADAAHRVTLLATHDAAGTLLPVIDGATWDPFCRRLLFTAEGGATTGGVWQATVGFPSTVVDISGYLGRGGYEGIQNDGQGNVYLVEDVGGTKGTVNSHARQPNSFLYRYLPTNIADLTAGGVLQALQVESIANPGQPIVFHAGQADADILSQDIADMHTYGLVFVTHWVTIHDTAVDGTAPFSANALAKAASATPFKRPENGVFRPGSDFAEFYFTATGDTDANTEAGSLFGGFGAIFAWKKTAGSTIDGTLSLLYRCDIDHSGFDNIAFWGADELVAVEDRGDTLHAQHNALDSAFLFDATVDYGNVGAPAPLRLLALGRDASATLDSGLLGVSGNGFQNDGDNEITGIHVSDGNPRAMGILGARVPTPFASGWRVFYAQQHGDNTLFEVLPNPH